jgi:maleylacetoacetate isomerase
MSTEVHKTPYPSPPSHPYTYTLYTFFGSSCTARVRIACHHKRIPLTYRFIKLHKGGQYHEEYTKINPSQQVPGLVVHQKGDEQGKPVAVITQSVAIIEYLDEVFPTDVKLLPSPSNPLARARVRELTNVIVCDLQPLTNLRVFKYAGDLLCAADKTNRADWKEDEWQRHFMTLGIQAYENLLGGADDLPMESRQGRFTVGDQVSLADVCLIAAVDRANKYEVDMTKFPRVVAIDTAMRETTGYKLGGLRTQPDTFRSLRLEQGRL